MKRLLIFIVAIALVFTLSSCDTSKNSLTILLVSPTDKTNDFLEDVSALPDLLITELARVGYDYDEIIIGITDDYELALQKLNDGEADIALVQSKYYSDSYDVSELVSAYSFTIDYSVEVETPGIIITDMPIVGPPIPSRTTQQEMILVGPSVKGIELLNIFLDSNDELTFEDLDSANWCLYNDYYNYNLNYVDDYLSGFNNHSSSDLSNLTYTDSLEEVFEMLANETCDITNIDSSNRMSFFFNWINVDGFNREESLMSETKIIGVSEGYLNDTFYSSNETVDSDLRNALQQALISLRSTDEGKVLLVELGYKGFKTN